MIIESTLHYCFLRESVVNSPIHYRTVAWLRGAGIDFKAIWVPGSTREWHLEGRADATSQRARLSAVAAALGTKSKYGWLRMPLVYPN